MTSPDSFLAHFGIKGMKWGVRRDNPSGTSPVSAGASKKEVKARVKNNVEFLKNTPTGEVRSAVVRPGTRIQSAGGKNLPAHEDAVRAAQSRQKAKGSTLDALSTPELQALVTRLNLEQQYSKLTTPQNKNTLKEGLKKVNQIIETKKTVDKLMEDPFIKETVGNVAQDLGLDKLILKGTRKVFGG